MGQKVNIKIGERSYSLTAATPEKERVFRLAADSVNRRYDELVRIVGAYVVYRLVKCLQALEPVALIKSQIGFVCNAEIGRGVNYFFVKGEYRILPVQQVLRDFADIGVKTYAQKRFLAHYVLIQLFSCHMC